MTNVPGDVAADSPAMRRVLSMVERVAGCSVPVLISGESGVGKELLARHIHGRSPRRSGPFLKVNCAALPAEPLEAELFGHERGAFPGADATRMGKFEFAHGGTLMLDEIGEMPAVLQARLRQVLEDRAVTRLGTNAAVPVNVRVISATSRRLHESMRSGNFRPDLYYRIQVVEIHVPPLRERRAEILPLAERFLATHAARSPRGPRGLGEAMRRALLSYDWPGNVRELQNVMRRVAILGDEAAIRRELLDAEAQADGGLGSRPAGENGRAAAPLVQVSKRAAQAAERDAIERTLAVCRWNRRRAARELGVSYKTLLNKMRVCGLSALSSNQSAM